jgi:hypothetical protein
MNNILGKITGLFGGGQQSAPARRGYFKSMVIEAGDTAYNTAAKIIALAPAVGVKMRIWEFTVPAQMEVSWGFGSPAFPDNQGYIWFAAGLAGTGFDVGTVMLSHENHSRHNTIPIDEFVDSSTHTSTNTSLATARSLDKKQLRALPEAVGAPTVMQDSRLVIDYTAITLVAEDIWGFDIPCTVYD